MPIEHFEIAYNHYLKTGKVVLDEYAEIKYLLWEAREKEISNYSNQPFNYYKNDYIKYLIKLFHNKGFWNINYFYSEEEKLLVFNYLKSCLKKIRYLKSQKNKRKVASLYINNQEIRRKIFRRDGRKCSKCGSKENLTLDHIIPVSKGGKNKLENLQVLCKSCNSKKGSKRKKYNGKTS